MLSFRQLVEKSNPSAHKGYLIALDPGETTGYCVMHDLKIIEAGQLATKDLETGYAVLYALFWKYAPQGEVRLICEDYRVYSWKTEQHNWAGLHTPKLIGVITALAILLHIRMDTEMAVEAKGFCTDQRMVDWEFWIPGQKHARDAIRHAVFYTLFKTGDKDKEK